MKKRPVRCPRRTRRTGIFFDTCQRADVPDEVLGAMDAVSDEASGSTAGLFVTVRTSRSVSAHFDHASAYEPSFGCSSLSKTTAPSSVTP